MITKVQMMTPDESNQAEIRLLRQQLAEKDAVLGMLAEALRLHGVHDDGCQGRRRSNECTCGLAAALSPDFVQAAERYRRALAVVERVKDFEWLSNRIYAGMHPQQQPMEQSETIARLLQSALLGTQAEAVSDSLP